MNQMNEDNNVVSVIFKIGWTVFLFEMAYAAFIMLTRHGVLFHG